MLKLSITLLKQEVDPAEWGVGALAANFDEEVPLMEGEGTRRLALLDMDWEHVRAVDILMVLRSFLAEVRLPSPPRNLHFMFRQPRGSTLCPMIAEC